MLKEGDGLLGDRHKNAFYDNVDVCPQLLFTNKILVDKRKSSHWWDHIANNTLSTRDWLENFRMSQATFVYVCDELRSTTEKADTDMRKAIPVEQKLL